MAQALNQNKLMETVPQFYRIIDELYNATISMHIDDLILNQNLVYKITQNY